jgi:dienelactone hydrolase
MLLADQFASAGYTTLIIDLYNGDALKMEEVPELDLQAWIKNGRNGSGPHTPTEIDPIIGEAVSYMKTDLGVERIGAVGFSFGSKYVVRHLGRGIQVAYVGYPSFVDDEELTAVGGPLSIAAAETETIFSLDKRIRAEEILRQNGNVYQINLFSGVSHGFAVTCDLENRRERFGKEQAFKQAVEFFDYWLV